MVLAGNEPDRKELPASHRGVMCGQGESWKPGARGAVRQLEARSLPAGLRTEGLFRRSASVQTIREIQRLYNQGERLPGTPHPEPPARPARRRLRAPTPEAAELPCPPTPGIAQSWGGCPGGSWGRWPPMPFCH